MRKFIVTSFLSISSLLFFACGGNDGEEKKSSLIEDNNTTTSTEENTTTNTTENSESAESQIVVALWNASIKEEGKQSGKWKASYKYGETLTLLGEEAVEGKRTFLKVRTIEGKEGWTSDYLVAKDAKYAVITQDVIIYSKPTPIGVSKEKLKVGDFVAVYNEDMNGYHEFHGKEKKSKGWIKKGYSFDETDIEVAHFRQHILEEKDEERKQLLLQELEDNSDYQSSPFYSIILEENTPEENVEALPEEVITDPSEEQMTEVLEDAVDGTESETADPIEH